MSSHSSEEARLRYAHISAGHIPDIIRYKAIGHDVWEWKCTTPFLLRPALGFGSRAHGGKPSQADGGRFAMGNTAENLAYISLGISATQARGSPVDGPLDRHQTGTPASVGWVAETTDHDYADAQRRGSTVVLATTETTGAFCQGIDRALRALNAQSRLPTTHDSTVYGTARTSPRTFHAHHSAAISVAIVTSHATLIHERAMHMSSMLTLGLTPAD